jgi:gliding motility-associated-like protein
MTFSVTGFDEDGCSDTEYHTVNLYPRAMVRAGNDRIIEYGEEIILESFSIYPVTWEEDPELSCLNCDDPVVSPLETSTFYATIVSPDGCIERDSVTVTVIGSIYVPNAFTPDGDGINDIFKAEGIDIVEFRMEIFNRWGELIFVSENINDGWNGSSGNENYYTQGQIYPYRIVAREHTGKVFELKGYVTLIR